MRGVAAAAALGARRTSSSAAAAAASGPLNRRWEGVLTVRAPRRDRGTNAREVRERDQYIQSRGAASKAVSPAGQDDRIDWCGGDDDARRTAEKKEKRNLSFAGYHTARGATTLGNGFFVSG